MQLAESGIRNIELSGGTEYYPDLEKDLMQLKKRYSLNLACHAYFPPSQESIVVNLASCDDDIYRKTIQHYENCIGLMEKLECEVLSVHAGFFIRIGVGEIGKKLRSTVVYDRGKAYDRFYSGYEYIKDLCLKKGIILYLENNVLSNENYQEFQKQNYLMMTDYKSIMEMKERIDFNLLLDLGHLYVSANTLQLDYQKECTNLKGYAKWLHISENDGKEDQHFPIKGKSEIVNALEETYCADIDITLETAGNLEEVVNSAEYIRDALI